MTRKRRSFSPEFKQEAASLVLDQGYSFAQACMSLGMGESVLRRWVQQLAEERKGVTPRGNALTPEQRRIQELEARCRRLEQEKDILKKATVDSTGQCNIMHTGNYRGFQNAAASFKNQRTDLSAEAGAMGSVEERAVA
jgi:transposase